MLSVSYRLSVPDTIPAVFTDIHLHFVVKGSAIKEAQVKKSHRVIGRKILLSQSYARKWRCQNHP